MKRIKWENIFLLIAIPLAVIQFFKAANGYHLISIWTSLTVYGGTYIMIRMIRKGEE